MHAVHAETYGTFQRHINAVASYALAIDHAKEDTVNSGVSGVHPAPTNSNLDDAAQAEEDVKAGANLIAGIVENK